VAPFAEHQVPDPQQEDSLGSQDTGAFKTRICAVQFADCPGRRMDLAPECQPRLRRRVLVKACGPKRLPVTPLGI